MAEWLYDPRSRRYKDLQTGRYLSAAASLELRDDLIVRMAVETRALAERLASGDIALPAWERAMRTAVRDANVTQYAFGRGGRNAMTADDLSALGDLVTAQHEYLSGFAADIASGGLSDARIAARAALYTASSVQAYERGKASAWDVTLPHHPGDSSTICRANCRCSWSLVEKEDTVEATWVRHAQDSCATCVARAAEYNPLVLTRADAGRITRLDRRVA